MLSGLDTLPVDSSLERIATGVFEPWEGSRSEATSQETCHETMMPQSRE